MAFELIIKPIVFLDAEEAVIYYNQKLEGLGKRFFTNFLNALERIQQSPFVYTVIKGSVRRCLVQKFPYKVYYIVTNETVFVIGLAHVKRSNAFVKRRLKLL